MNHWLAKTGLIVLITPSTCVLLFLAMTLGLGVPVMAESGRRPGSGPDALAALLLLAGIGAVWKAVLSGAARGRGHGYRIGLAAIIGIGLTAGLLWVSAEMSDDPFVFVVFAPVLAVATIQLVRLVRDDSQA